MKITNKSALMIRAMLAVYLLYLAYGLIKDYSTSNHQTLVVIGIVVFAICGGVILLSAVIRLVKGDYDNQKDDSDDHAE